MFGPCCKLPKDDAYAARRRHLLAWPHGCAAPDLPAFAGGGGPQGHGLSFRANSRPARRRRQCRRRGDPAAGFFGEAPPSRTASGATGPCIAMYGQAALTALAGRSGALKHALPCQILLRHPRQTKAVLRADGILLARCRSANHRFAHLAQRTRQAAADSGQPVRLGNWKICAGSSRSATSCACRGVIRTGHASTSAAEGLMLLKRQARSTCASSHGAAVCHAIP